MMLVFNSINARSLQGAMSLLQKFPMQYQLNKITISSSQASCIQPKFGHDHKLQNQPPTSSKSTDSQPMSSIRECSKLQIRLMLTRIGFNYCSKSFRNPVTESTSQSKVPKPESRQSSILWR